MDRQHKIKIFEKYDFSKTAILKKAGVNLENQKSELYHGIANKTQTLITNTEILSSEQLTDIQEYKNIEDRVLRDYGWLQIKYQTIDWNELDADDPDCRIFFEVKELIDGVGQYVDAFLLKSRLEFKCPSKEYTELKQKIEELNEKTMAFKDIKKRLAEPDDQ